MLKNLGLFVCALSALFLVPGCGGSSTGGSEGNGGTAGSGQGGSGQGGSGTGGTSNGGNGGSGGEPLGYSSQLDLLLVVDNSAATGANHDRLADGVADLISRLRNPDCVAPDGARSNPGTPDAACPGGSERVHAPVKDLNVGVITSSLGAAGSQYCKNQNDQAHLLPTLRDELSGASADGVYELREGEDPNAFIADIQSAVRSTGQSGCGFEMPLEAMFRFLMDPDPYASLERVDCNPQDTARSCVSMTGTDEAVLRQRKAFLRPGSTVAVVMVGEENDCSVQAGGQYFYAFEPDLFEARPTATCATNPNDACCYSCAQGQAAGCPSKESECGASTPGDELNLRCWDQKRRLGLDFMYPVARYVAGLKERTIPGGAVGQASFSNPLFIDNTRSAEQVHFLTLGGAPPEYLTEMNADGSARYLSNLELGSKNLWPQIVGDPATYQPPQDPFMVESQAPRTGVSSLSGVSPADANDVNGGDVAGGTSRLQFACMDRLPSPLECLGDEACMCDQPDGNPACSSGGLQIAVPAYPTLRQFAVAKDSGGDIASLCEYGQVPGRVDTGYGASFELLQKSLSSTLR